MYLGAQWGRNVNKVEEIIECTKIQLKSIETDRPYAHHVLYKALQILIRLYEAIKEHHSQKADDRCIEDDDKLYRSACLPKCDRRVGSKKAMLKNCERYVNQRCEEGHWKTYAELEAEIVRLNEEVTRLTNASVKT